MKIAQLLNFKKQLKRFLRWAFALSKGLYFVYLLVVFFFMICTFFILKDSVLRFIVPILILISYEAFFRFVYHLYHKKNLPSKYLTKREEIPIEEHPYLPWVYKKNYIPPQKKIYEDERAGYMLGGIRTNNLRHVNGPDGGRDVEIPKPNGMYRIICLGDSTTCNYVYTNERKLISWPLILEKLLKKKWPNQVIEVNNCASGGYNTNEILIKFLIDTIDTEPDMVIFYHAFVNVRGYLTPNFERDFYHFRRTISFNYPKFVRIARYIPDFGLWCFRYIIGEFLAYGNIKEDLVRMINRTNTIDREKMPEGLEVFERNIENLIHICKGKGIQLILSTYSYHLYKEISDSKIHQKFYGIVMQENEIIKKLAHRYSIPLVDNQKSIPSHDDYFADEVHPTELGMRKMSENFYKKIVPFIKERIENVRSY